MNTLIRYAVSRKFFRGLSALMGGSARETILAVAYQDQPEPSFMYSEGKYED